MMEELFERYLRDELSPDEVRELNRQLEREEIRKAFVAYLQEWSLLGGVAAQMQKTSGTRPRLRVTSRPPAWAALFAGVAAGVLLTVGILWLTRAPAPVESPVPVSDRVVELPTEAPDPVPARPARPERETPAVPPRPEVAPPVPAPVPESEPVPAPPPPPRPAEPAPLPAPPVPKPPVESVVAVARVEDVEGEAFVGRTPARKGAAIAVGAGVETREGRLGVAFPDGTKLEVAPGTRLGDFEEKTFLLAAGRVTAEVVRQRAGEPMVFRTQEAEAVVLGTRLTLEATTGRTLLRVWKGRVRLKRNDGLSILVGTGQEGEVAADVPFRTRPLVLTLDFQDGPEYSDTRDTAISEVEPGRTFGGDDVLEVDGDEVGGKSMWGLVRWDLSAIPPGSVVTSVVMTLNVEGRSEKTDYRIYAARRPWSEGATWREAEPGRSWGRPGARSPADRTGTELGRFSPRRAGPMEILLNDAGMAVVQAWIRTPAANHGFLLGNDANSDGFKFSSREAKDRTTRPKLTVTFAAPRR